MNSRTLDRTSPEAGLLPAHAVASNTRSLYIACLVAVGLHLVLLAVALMIKIGTEVFEQAFVIETIVAEEERMIEEFVKELDTQQEIATTLNFQAGSISTNVGGTATNFSNQRKIEELMEPVTEPDQFLHMALYDLVGESVLGEDLGEAEVTGEIGAIVEGYGPALDRLTQELIRLMRTNRLLVVWMFDESESMKQDQEEIRNRLDRVYQELKLVGEHDGTVETSTRRASRPRNGDDVILTAVTSFGERFRPGYASGQAPTSDVAVLMDDITKIPEDPSGKEETYKSLDEVLRRYGPMALRNRRKLVVILVTDESGDDGDGLFLEQVLSRAKTLKAPLYFLGRESSFGSYFAHVEWRHPYSGAIHYLPVRRGPETAYPEALQHNGFGRRTDSQMSGFGPYTQVRLARETGGIFFQLPGELSDLSDFEQYKYEMLKLREYLPDLETRREYEATVRQSKFRSTLWEIILVLDPYKKEKDGRIVAGSFGDRTEIIVPTDGWFDVDDSRGPGGDPNVRDRIQRINRVLSLLAISEKKLEEIKPLREQEASLRWRANFDLMHAQMLAYQVRLYEYGIALQQFQRDLPRLLAARNTNPVHNRWRAAVGFDEMILPDEAQARALNISPEQFEEAHRVALERLDVVKNGHPDSPWARRAEWEMKRKFGVRFESYYQPPPSNTPSPTTSRPPVRIPEL